MNESPAQPTYHVFSCRVHGIFTSPTMNTFPPCCNFKILPQLSFQMECPSCAHHCLLSDNHFAFLTHTPKSLSWECPLMNVLRLTHGTYLKWTKNSGFWGLKWAIQADWALLECNLCAICQCMEVHITLASLDAESCPLPCSYGYL